MNICAIDIGTSRIKTAVFTEEGKMSFLSGKRLPRAQSPDTQDADVWYDSVASLLQSLTEKTKVDAVVLTGNMHALLGVDNKGNAVEKALLWSDQSSQKESDILNKNYEKILLRDFGNSSIPVFTLPKLLKMKAERLEVYNKTQKFLQSKDFILFRLTGNLVTDPSDASGTLLMQYDSNTWSEDLCKELAIDKEKLPQILPSASVCGYVTEKAAKETGLLSGTPVITGCGDLASAALGSGVNEETFSLTLGTAGQLLASGRNHSKDLAGKIFVFAHADPARELYLGSIPSGGFTFEYLSALHNIPIEDFFRKAAEVLLSEDLPIFLPYILGKGAPYMDYESNGAWFKLSAAHNISHICRSAVFGVLASLHQNSVLLHNLGIQGNTLVLQALACREQVVRDTANALFPQEKYLPENSEASLLGAAILGFAAMNVYKSIPESAAKLIKKTYLSPPLPREKETAEHLYKIWCLYRDMI
ncbi:MAG: hypothetical protein J6S53_04400 [Lentisphaeria bacterium]|nr:hypothetical protein [Lentisphaeria bacterium]